MQQLESKTNAKCLRALPNLLTAVKADLMRRTNLYRPVRSNFYRPGGVSAKLIPV